MAQIASEVFDLKPTIEEFRDSVSTEQIQRRTVTFGTLFVDGALALTPAGRKGFLRAYELRMAVAARGAADFADSLVTHLLFEYRVSYRRLLEIPPEGQ